MPDRRRGLRAAWTRDGGCCSSRVAVRGGRGVARARPTVGSAGRTGCAGVVSTRLDRRGSTTHGRDGSARPTDGRRRRGRRVGAGRHVVRRAAGRAGHAAAVLLRVLRPVPGDPAGAWTTSPGRSRASPTSRSTPRRISTWSAPRHPAYPDHARARRARPRGDPGDRAPRAGPGPGRAGAERRDVRHVDGRLAHTETNVGADTSARPTVPGMLRRCSRSAAQWTTAASAPRCVECPDDGPLRHVILYRFGRLCGPTLPQPVRRQEPHVHAHHPVPTGSGSTRAVRGSPRPSPPSCWCSCCSRRHRSRRCCSRSRPRSSRIGAFRGIQHTPYAVLFRRRSGRASAPPERARGRPAAALRPGRRARLRAGRPGRAARRRHRARARRGRARAGGRLAQRGLRLLPRLRDVPAASARADRPLTRPPRPPTPRRTPGVPKGKRPMSRDTALVSADWVEEHLDDPSVVFVEVDEDTTAYDTGHIPGAIKLDWKTDLQDPVRRDFVNKEQFEALLSARGHRQRRHRRALRRQQQLVRRLRLLVLQALRPRRRQAARRRPQEVGARQPRRWSPSVPERAATDVHRAGAGHRRSAPSATTSSPRSARRTWSTSARPTSTPAGCSPRPTCRRSRRSGPATSRPRSTCRGRRPPTTTAPSSPTTSSSELYATPASTSAKDTIAYCRIGERSVAHLVRAARAARPGEREELRRLLDRVRLAGRRARSRSATTART